MKKYAPAFILIFEFLFMFSLIAAAILFYSLIEDIKTVESHSIWIKNNVNLYLPYTFLMISCLSGVFVYIILKSDSYNKSVLIDIQRKFIKVENLKEAKIKAENLQKELERIKQEDLQRKIRETIEALDQNCSDEEFKNILFKKICKNTDAVAGIYYEKSGDKLIKKFHYGGLIISEDKVDEENNEIDELEISESILSSVLKSNQPILIDKINTSLNDAFSGLGSASPKSYWAYPIAINGQQVAVIELGLFKSSTDDNQLYIAKVLDYLNQKK